LQPPKTLLASNEHILRGSSDFDSHNPVDVHHDNDDTVSQSSESSYQEASDWKSDSDTEDDGSDEEETADAPEAHRDDKLRVLNEFQSNIGIILGPHLVKYKSTTVAEFHGYMIEWSRSTKKMTLTDTIYLRRADAKTEAIEPHSALLQKADGNTALSIVVLRRRDRIRVRRQRNSSRRV
jgi:hypothetical protein